MAWRREPLRPASEMREASFHLNLDGWDLRKLFFLLAFFECVLSATSAVHKEIV